MSVSRLSLIAIGFAFFMGSTSLIAGKPKKPVPPKKGAASTGDVLLIGVGYPGTQNLQGMIVSSKDGGKSWKEVWFDDGKNKSVRDIIYVPETKKFVAVGRVGVLTSSDGAKFKSAKVPESAGELQAVAYGGGMYVAVGESTGIIYSKDGETWTHVLLGADGKTYDSEKTKVWSEKVFGAYGKMHYYDVLFMDGKFVVTGSYDRALMLVPKGDKLEIASDVRNGDDPFEQAKGIVTDGKGTAVILSKYLNFVSKDNGATWTKIRGLKERDLVRGAYGKGKFVAVGHFSKIVTSTDGEKWKDAEGVPDRLTVWDVAFGGGKFYATTSNSDIILVSDDGEKWTQVDAKLTEGEEKYSLNFQGIIAVSP